MRIMISMLVCVGVCVAMAESNNAQVNPAPQNGSMSGNAPSPAQRNYGISVFDDRVFDLSVDKPVPTFVIDPETGQKRYLAPEADYNTKTRQDAIDKCSGREDYKLCYKREMETQRLELKKKMDGTDRQQFDPYNKEKSQGGDPYNSGEPAIGGVSEERK